jgi:hypothetical protein
VGCICNGAVRLGAFDVQLLLLVTSSKKRWPERHEDPGGIRSSTAVAGNTEAMGKLASGHALYRR